MSWSGSMREGRARGGVAAAGLAALAILVTGLPAGAEEGEGVGQVLALVGEARAVAPDGRVRRLHCFDRVHEGEIVYTKGGSRVGLLSAELYAQLDPGANVAYGEAERGIPRLRILDGSVRFVDTRPGGAGPKLRVETPEGRMSSLGSDMRVAVERRAEARESTQVCESASPVEIARFRPTDAIERTDAGQCTLVSSAGTIERAARRPEREVALAGADACQFDSLGTIAARLSPADVAAPPIAIADFPARDPAAAADRDPCDDPGAGCSVASATAPTSEPPPPVQQAPDQDPPTGLPDDPSNPPPGTVVE